MAKIKKVTVDYYHFYCPGCKHQHTYTVASDGSQWRFNGNMERPSFTDSLLNRMPVQNESGAWVEKARCHLFVTDGKIIYCSDCTHDLAGQTVELQDIT